MTNLDETELARLEELAGKIDMLPVDVGDLVCLYIDGLDECRSSYIAAACNAVPALVAEVRRMREDVCALRDSFDCEHEALMRHEHMVAELMEKVEEWEWWEEAYYLYDNVAWLFDLRQCAIDELYATLTSAKEAVHADRE